jgi:hypothetical protein
MATPDDEPIIAPQEGGHDGKTVILQRCPIHGTLFMPKEGCPDCAKEKAAQEK